MENRSRTFIGLGESLLPGIDLSQLGYQCADQVMSLAALHVVLRK